MTNESFYNFPKSNKQEWIEKVQKDLKGKDFKETLITKVWGELDVMPLYSSEDLAPSNYSFRFHEKTKLPGLAPRIWNNVVSFYPEDEKKCNQEIIYALENGADAIAIHLSGEENLNLILKGVLTEFIHLYFVPQGPPKLLYEQILEWIESLQIKPTMLQGAVIWSPTSDLFDRESEFLENIELGAEMVNKFSAFREFFPMTLDIAKYADSGANGIQQVYLGLGEMIEMMDSFISKAVTPAMVFDNFAFYASVGELFFPEISKLKAFRILLVELAGNMGQEIPPESLHLIVSTSDFSNSLIDKNSNLIRLTYEAMSAILGGSNSIWVKPINEKSASVLEKRIARNISSILKEESFLDKVIDPTAGSFYVESLIKEIKTKVLRKLELLEDEGGWLENFNSRKIHKLVRGEREKVQELVLKSESIKVGVNKYEAKSELASNGSFEGFEEKDYELKPTRATYLLERNKLKKA
ncbi:methylmalonyl-CoA mutase family protein [Algoriphagus sp.]|uniref:methylmalonyl-CoA mutase family protein n=1 Tax=Algoriphagus sp. TaxID=1872435 RepID=UPI0025D40A8D|nr:methylmalonyl-CoA mutase family protein [Algoriphagus sp.]